MNKFKSQPFISIILPVFNGEEYLDDTLQSIFKQDYKHFEVIVVDDGSIDNSEKISKSYNVRYFYQENQGVAAARNYGIKLAKGEIVAFIDQDDTWLPGKLMKQINQMISEHELGYVLTYQMLKLAVGINKIPAWVRKNQLNKPIVGYLPSTLMVRKDVFDKIGLFNPDYNTGSDTEWFFRAKDNHIKMEILQEVLTLRKIHKYNHSNLVGDSHIELLRIIRSSIFRKQMLKRDNSK